MASVREKRTNEYQMTQLTWHRVSNMPKQKDSKNYEQQGEEDTASQNFCPSRYIYYPTFAFEETRHINRICIPFDSHCNIGFYLSPHVCGWPLLSKLDMDLNLQVISVNEGLTPGSSNQHCSISFPQLGSHHSGIVGRREPLRMPPTCVLYN